MKPPRSKLRGIKMSRTRNVREASFGNCVLQGIKRAMPSLGNDRDRAWSKAADDGLIQSERIGLQIKIIDHITGHEFVLLISA